VAYERWESKLTPELRRSAVAAGNGSFRVIIELAEEPGDQVKSMILSNHGVINREINTLMMVVAEVPAMLLQRLAQLEQVKMIQKDSITKICND